MPTEYTLTDLAKIADVTPRTIRYYIAQGLLSSPTQLGPAARYTEAHLERLRLIKKLQAADMPLAKIRARLRGLGDDEIATISTSVETAPRPSKAIDYVRQLLGERSPRESSVNDQPVHYQSVTPASMPAAAPPSSKPQGPDPDRSQWERISLDPDVELHVRRPLGRLKNRRVDRLISIARQLLEEE